MFDKIMITMIQLICCFDKMSIDTLSFRVLKKQSVAKLMILLLRFICPPLIAQNRQMRYRSTFFLVVVIYHFILVSVALIHNYFRLF